MNHLARRHRISLRGLKSRAKLGTGEIAGEAVVLAKPQTYMNLSGESVRLLVRRYAVPVEDLLVIYDDLDLPVGKLRIRERGGSGGHKGMESIIAALESDEFCRIRVGIGRPVGDAVSYVLRGFTAEEKRIVDRVLATVSDAVWCILTEGAETAMNRFN